MRSSSELVSAMCKPSNIRRDTRNSDPLALARGLFSVPAAARAASRSPSRRSAKTVPCLTFGMFAFYSKYMSLDQSKVVSL